MNSNEDNVNWDRNNISNNNNSINEEKNNNINKNDLMKKIKTNIKIKIVAPIIKTITVIIYSDRFFVYTFIFFICMIFILCFYLHIAIFKREWHYILMTLKGCRSKITDF